MKEILNAKIRDWRVGQGEPVPLEDDTQYSIKMNFDEKCGQLYFDIEDGSEKGLTGIIEINNGRPCIHLGVDMGGDNLLHAFALKSGLVVTPESNDKNATKKAEPDRYSYNSFNGTLYVAE